MIIKKIRNIVYTTLFCLLIGLGAGMGVFALTNGNVGAYIDIFYEYSTPVLSKSKFQSAYNGESAIYFDYYDDETCTSYTIDGSANLISGLSAVNLSSQADGSIKAYSNGASLYVLCNETITLPYDVSSMFSGYTALRTIKFNNIDTQHCTKMQYMFLNCKLLESLDLTNFNTSNVANMAQMFNHCDVATSIDVSSFNTAKVTDMSYMFNNCYALKSLDVSSFDTSNVTTMKAMFRVIPAAVGTLDLSNFNTSKVTDMTSMFNSTKVHTILVGEGWNTDNVTESTEMFVNCTNLKGSISYSASNPSDKTYATTTGGYLTLKTA